MSGQSPQTKRRRDQETKGRENYAHFLRIVCGSLAETHYFLYLARRLGYLEDAQAVRVEALAKRSFACLHGLILAVRKEA